MKPLADCETQIGIQMNSKGHHVLWANMRITKDVGPLIVNIRIFIYFMREMRCMYFCMF